MDKIFKNNSSCIGKMKEQVHLFQYWHICIVFKVIPTKDRLEGLAAFKEKRRPHYKGEWDKTTYRSNYMPSVLLMFHCFQHINGWNCTRWHINLYSIQGTSAWPQDIRVDPGWCFLRVTWMFKCKALAGHVNYHLSIRRTKWINQALASAYNMWT